MKTSLPLQGGFKTCLVLAIASVIPQVSFAEGYPHGSLAVARDMVRLNTKVPLSWQIQYPDGADIGIDTTSPNKIKITKDLNMQVHVLGASFKTKSNNGLGNNADGVDSSNPAIIKSGAYDPSAGIDDEIKSKSGDESALPIQLVWSKNYAEWTSLFFGTQADMVAAKNLFINPVPVKAGDVIDFGAQGFRNGWLPFYSTTVSTPNVVILKNGDPAPATYAFKSKQVNGYLDPYLSTDHRTVAIGPNDLLILMELDGSDPNAASFNLQDLGLLVTIK